MPFTCFVLSCLVLLEPFVDSTQLSALQSKLCFDVSCASDNKKIWVLCRRGITFHVEYQTSQLLHLRLDGFIGSPVFVTAIYAKSTRADRRTLWSDLLLLQNSIVDVPWLVGAIFML